MKKVFAHYTRADCYLKQQQQRQRQQQQQQKINYSTFSLQIYFLLLFIHYLLFIIYMYSYLCPHPPQSQSHVPHRTAEDSLRTHLLQTDQNALQHSTAICGLTNFCIALEKMNFVVFSMKTIFSRRNFPKFLKKTSSISITSCPPGRE